ncbi:MAG: group I intron-associated PD-(D/E)XK endonuclease [Acidimicrobiia bacterium]
MVLTALCEHAPFDLVGYRDGAFIRVQVKYRAVPAIGLVVSDTESQPPGAKRPRGR